MRTKLTAAWLVFVALLLFVGLMASSVMVQAAAHAITLTPSTGGAAATVAVDGTGFNPSVAVTIEWAWDNSGVTSTVSTAGLTSDIAGVFADTITVPTPATCNDLGDATVTATGTSGSASAAFTFTGLVRNETTLETFSTIQAAIDDAGTLAGHTLCVAPGTYTETVVVSKGLTLTSRDGPATTIIDGSGTTFTKVVSITADNVTFGNGGFTVDAASSAEGALSVTASNVVVQNNVLDASITNYAAVSIFNPATTTFRFLTTLY